MAIKRAAVAGYAIINSAILSASILLGPAGAIAAITASALFAYVLLSQIGFVVLLTLISHMNDSFSLDFDIVRVVRWLIVGFAGIIAIWQFLINNDWRDIRVCLIERYFAIFFVWGVICLFFASSPFDSVLEFSRLLLLYVIYFITKSTVRTKRDLVVVLSAIVFIVLTSSLYSFGSLMQGHYFRVRGFMNNPGAYAQVLGFTVPFIVAAAFVARSTFLRRFLVFVAVCGVLALFLAWSRASIIACIVQFVVFAVAEKKYRLLVSTGFALVAIVIAALSIPQVYDMIYQVARVQAGSTHRETLWAAGINVIKKNPVFGQGFRVSIDDAIDHVQWNNVSESFLFQKSDMQFNVHNHYLHSMVTTGIPGLFIFLGFLYYLIRNSIHNCRYEPDRRRRIFFTAILSVNISLVVVSMFANAPIFTSGSMANYYWIVLGLTDAIKDHSIEI